MRFSLADHTNIFEEPAASIFKVPHTLKAEATSTNHQIMSCSKRQSYRKMKVKKGKAIPVTGHGGISGCGALRFPHHLNNRLPAGSEVVSLTHQPPSPPPPSTKKKCKIQIHFQDLKSGYLHLFSDWGIQWTTPVKCRIWFQSPILKWQNLPKKLEVIKTQPAIWQWFTS
jgi:hypothetical protein